MTTAPATTTAVLLEALGRGIPGDRLVVDEDLLASLSHDEAEWAAAGRAAVGLRAAQQEVRRALDPLNVFNPGKVIAL